MYSALMLIVSIILEAAVAVIAALAARAGRPYLYGLSFTFAAYVLYDVVRLLQWPVEGPVLSGLFLLATRCWQYGGYIGRGGGSSLLGLHKSEGHRP